MSYVSGHSGGQGRQGRSTGLQEEIVTLVAIRRPTGTLVQQQSHTLAMNATGTHGFQDGHHQGSSGWSEMGVTGFFQQFQQLRDQVAVDRLLDELFRPVGRVEEPFQVFQARVDVFGMVADGYGHGLDAFQSRQGVDASATVGNGIQEVQQSANC